MIEMTVGSRFYYGDKLCEVTEGWRICNHCVLYDNTTKCEKAKCSIDERHDGKNVYFKEVKDNISENLRKLNEVKIIKMILSTAIHNALNNSGIEITQCTCEQLMALRNIEKKVIEETVQELNDFDLSLKKEEDSEQEIQSDKE